MSGEMSPCFFVSCTCGRRTYETFTPRAATAAPVSSEILRGFAWLASKTSSLASSPGPRLPMPVPDVMMSGRFEPTSASPMASMFRLSF